MTDDRSAADRFRFLPFRCWFPTGTTTERPTDQPSQPFSAAWHKQLRRSVTAAVDVFLPIPPLLELICGYADFSGDILTASTYAGFDFGAVFADGPSLLAVDVGKSQIWRYDPASNNLSVFIGNGVVRPPKLGSAICADPSRPGRYYVADHRSIWRIDGRKMAPVTDVFRTDGFALQDFDGIGGVVCASHGRTLYVTDCNRHRLSEVKTETGQIVRLAGNGRKLQVDGLFLDCSIEFPLNLAFCTRSATDSVLFITSSWFIRRFDVVTGRMSTLSWHFGIKRMEPRAIVCLPNGLLVFTCDLTDTVYIGDPATLELEPIASTATERSDAGRAIVNDMAAGADRIWMVQDDRIRFLALPSQLFVRPVIASVVSAPVSAGRSCSVM